MYGETSEYEYNTQKYRTSKQCTSLVNIDINIMPMLHDALVRHIRIYHNFHAIVTAIPSGTTSNLMWKYDSLHMKSNHQYLQHNINFY